MKKLYFIRHGLSELNVKGLYAGHTDTPLTEEGRKQAKIAGQEAKNLKIGLIISSPLSRALETAQVVAEEIGYPSDDIVVDDCLIERSFGALESKPWSRTHTYKYQLEYGAESNEQLIKRTRQILDWIEKQPVDNVLVIGHGASGRALRSLIKTDFPMSHPHQLGNAKLYEWL